VRDCQPPLQLPGWSM